MLTQLHIENIAVIKKASFPLKKGLNVFTGETGAGKTILISAIDAVLGERTSRDIIRTGEDRAIVSALFEDISPHAKATLEEMGYEAEDDSVLVFREMTASGRNICKINGMPANVTILKEISSKLIHIHGQRDSQELLAPEYHMQMIDDFGELELQKEEYLEQYQQYHDLQEELESLTLDESQKIQRMDMLKFQINEIEAAHLKDPEEEDGLLAQRKVIHGSEKILKGFASAYSAWNGEDSLPGLQENLANFLAGVEDVAEYVSDFKPMMERVEELTYELEEYASQISYALDEYEFDPEELNRIEYRLDTIYRLKQKYGSNIEEILEHYQSASEEFEKISTNEEQKEKLEKKIAQKEKECLIIAKDLSKKRCTAAEEFTKRIEAELVFLDMPTVKLSAKRTEIPLSPEGVDRIEFFIVTNVGEAPKPLNRIASGGEISRIMLAIKNVLAHRDDVDTLIFDEVDTGVSGRAAGKIGRKLREVSKDRQVISVTHLAQVAAFADHHLLIAKDSDDAHTYTKVKALSHEETINELARITSGEVITPAALESATELWARARQDEAVPS